MTSGAATRRFVALTLATSLAACGGGSTARRASTDSSRARSDPSTFSDSARGPQLGDHVHVAYSVSVCGDEQQPYQDASGDRLGIHTHGDGLIHVHPFAASAAGRKATLELFLDDVGASVSNTKLTLPDGAFDARQDRCEGKAAALEAAVWDDPADADAGKNPDLVVTGDAINRIVLTANRAITIAFHREGTVIDAPPDAAARIATVSDVKPTPSS